MSVCVRTHACVCMNLSVCVCARVRVCACVCSLTGLLTWTGACVIRNERTAMKNFLLHDISKLNLNSVLTERAMLG